MELIGVFGGTFAPIHNGHLRLALESLERLALDEVRVVPNGRPPHRGAPGVAADRRLDWVRKACGSESGLVVDDREVRRAGASYMIDTLCSFRAEFPEASLSLLIGHDSARFFHRWHRWQELFDVAHLVVVDRPGADDVLPAEIFEYFQARRAVDAADIRDSRFGRFLSLQIPYMAISSSDIRARLGASRSLRGLIPQSVIDAMTPEDISNLTHDKESSQD